MRTSVTETQKNKSDRIEKMKTGYNGLNMYKIYVKLKADNITEQITEEEMEISRRLNG
jgi:hypothetical protein